MTSSAWDMDTADSAGWAASSDKPTPDQLEAARAAGQDAFAPMGSRENPWADTVQPVQTNTSPGWQSYGDWTVSKSSVQDPSASPAWMQDYMSSQPAASTPAQPETLSTTQDPWGYMQRIGMVGTGTSAPQQYQDEWTAGAPDNLGWVREAPAPAPAATTTTQTTTPATPAAPQKKLLDLEQAKKSLAADSQQWQQSPWFNHPAERPVDMSAPTVAPAAAPVAQPQSEAQPDKRPTPVSIAHTGKGTVLVTMSDGSVHEMPAADPSVMRAMAATQEPTQ